MTASRSFRTIAGCAALLCLSTCLLAAQSFEPFLREPVLSEAERASMMYSFVERNLPPIELPNTRAAWEKHKSELRQEILTLLGLQDIEQRGALRWESRGSLSRDTYTIERIIYESYPGMWVSGLVYVPRGLNGAAPAMLSIPGHWYCDGKAHPDIQARNVNLVRRGFIVFTYDYIGTFERNTGADPCAAMPYGGGNDHGLRGFSYTAGNPTGLEVRDAIRALDYLYTRSDIDRARIGATGESGGSNSTYWLAAVDDRLSLAVPVASVTSFEYWIRNDRNWDWHQRPAGIRRVAEISTLLAMFAPKPLLAISSIRGSDSEEFSLDEAERAVEQARPIYQLYGAADQIQIRESTTAHGYQQDKRELMYRWVEQHLAKRTPQETDMPFQLELRSSLVCGLPKDNKTLGGVYADWLNREPPEPRAIESKTSLQPRLEEMRRELASLLGVSSVVERSKNAKLSVQLATSRRDVLIRKLVIETAPGIHLPALELSSRSARPNGTVIIPGKNAELTPVVSEFLDQGLRVVLVDLRGTGEISSGGTRTDNWAWMMGRTWPGMWAEDLSGVISALTTELSETRFGVIGFGKFARPVLISVALDTRVDALFAELPTVSYQEEAKDGGLADVPRILAWHDLPIVAGMVAPRSCWLQFAHSVAPPESDARFRWSRQTYASAGAAASLRLEQASSPDWAIVARWFAERWRGSSGR